MEIFSKRYFLWISFVFLAFSALTFLIKIEYIVSLFVLLVFLLSVAILLNKKNRKKSIFVAILLIFAAFLGFFNSFSFSAKQDDIKERYCGERYVCGYVSDVVRSGSFSSQYLVELERVDGEDMSMQALLVSDFDAELHRGDFFEAHVSVLDIDECREELFIKNAYDGAVVCRVEDTDGIIFPDEEFRVSLLLKDINEKASAMLTTRINGVSGKMSSALLLGTRELLPDSTLRDFRRAGVYHMLALSGLHVSILVGIFEFILKKLYVKKFVRIIILTLLTLSYIALTGFLLSACRSMLMLFLFYLANIIGKRADSLTSLFGAVSVIVIISPRSVLDIGLILSFLATFAIIVASEIKNKLSFFTREVKGGVLRKKLILLARGMVFTAFASFCAIIATLPVIQAFFDEMSVVAVFTNLFVGVLVEALLVLAIGVLAFSGIYPVAYFLSRLAELVGNAMSGIVSWVADAENAVVSLNYPHTDVAVWVLFVVTLVLLGIKLKRKVLLLLPAAVFSVFFVVNVALFNHFRADTVAFEFVSADNNDCITVSSSDGFFMYDASGGSYSAFYNAGMLSRANCFTEISGIIITHYHTSHASSIERICSEQKVRAVYLPVPANEEDYLAFGAIVRGLEKSGSELYVFEPNEELSLLGGKLWVSDSVFSNGKAHPSVALSYSFREGRVTVIENPFFDTYLEENEKLQAFISDSDLLFFGGHGNPTRESFEAFEMVKGVKEIHFVNREILILSDIDCDAVDTFIDTGYKRYILE